MIQIEGNFLSLARFHVEEEGKGVDAAGAKVKADKEAVTKFRQSLRFDKLLMIEHLGVTLHKCTCLVQFCSDGVSFQEVG